MVALVLMAQPLNCLLLRNGSLVPRPTKEKESHSLCKTENGVGLAWERGHKMKHLRYEKNGFFPTESNRAGRSLGNYGYCYSIPFQTTTVPFHSRLLLLLHSIPD